METYITANNIRTRVCEWGRSDKLTIVCVHGLGSSAYSFLELAHELEEQFHFISIDLPGHGKTQAFRADDEYGIDNLTRWLKQVLDEICQGPVNFLAHSWGGCIALHYAARYPERVKKMMLLDGGYHQNNYDCNSKVGFASEEEEISYYMQDFDGYRFSTLKEAVDAELSNYDRTSIWMQKAVKDLVRMNEDGVFVWHATGDTARGAIKSMCRYPTKDIYERVNCPIYLLAALEPKEWEEKRRLWVEEFEKQTGAVVKWIKASHMLHWEQLENICEEVLLWFEPSTYM